MFGVLLWKEIRDHLMTFRFGAVLVTTFVLVIVSIWILGDDYIRRRNTYNRLSEEAANEVTEYRIPSHINPSVHYPPVSLSIFVQGKSKCLGNVVTVNRWEVPRDASDSLTDNELLAALTTFDLLAIFTFVISLFGVLLSYDSLSGERERGTLKMLYNSGSSRVSIFITKFLAGTFVLFLPLVVSLLCVLIILQFVFDISFTQNQWVAISSILFAGIVFGSLFIAIGMLCSSIFKRSSTSLALTLLTWTFAVILIPNVSTSLAPSLHPLPSPSEIDAFDKTTREDAIAEGREFVSRVRDEEQLNNVGFWGTIGANSYGNSIRWGTRDAFVLAERIISVCEPMWQERAERVWRLVREHEAELEKQARLADLLNSLSPAYLLKKVCTTLANTDYETYARFMERTRRFRREFLDDLENKGYFSDNAVAFVTQIPWDRRLSDEEFMQMEMEFIDRHGEGTGERWEDRISEYNWPQLPSDIVPAFVFDASQPQFHTALVPFAVLFLLVVITFVSGVFAFIRYDIR